MGIAAAMAAYYAYDGLRGDGYAVRMARLDMLTANVGAIWALCWAMEVAFAVAYFGRGVGVKATGCAAFWLAYVGILALVFEG